MQAVETSLTRLLGIRVPVVCAPMATGTTAHHAAEVTRGGGFGLVGAAFIPPEELRADLASARKSFPDLEEAPLPIGVGLIAWMLDANEEAGKKMVDVVLESNVQALWLAFGNDIYKWIQYARASRASGGSVHKPLIFVQVSSVEEALLAAKDWQADVVVAQGNEAGGHGGTSTPSTFMFVSDVLAALAEENTPPVLAAGGIVNGTQAAAYLTLGAAGAVLGTRFLLTPESPYTEVQKAAVLAAKSGSTVRTLAFDYGLGLYGWPKHIDGRGIRNRICEDIEAGVEHETLRARVTNGTREGDGDYTVIFCGQGVGLMHEVKAVKDVMVELHTDIVRQLRQSQHMLQA